MIARTSSFALVLSAFLGATVAFASPVAVELATASAGRDFSVPHATPLTRDNFLAAVSRDLTSHFNLEGDLVVEMIRPCDLPAQVAAVWTVNVTEFPTVATSSMMVRCRVVADATVVAEPTLVVRAMLWRDAWSTRAPLTAGAVFEPALLEARRVDMLRERDALPAAVGDRSYVFTRGVAPGRLLTWRDISRRPLVKKGEVVEVSAVDGTLVVTMKGVAMENGGQGDMVTVRNPDSRRDFSALVVDENRVQVRF